MGKIDMSLIYRKMFPWQMVFAKRNNYEFGYFTQEGEFVAKYLKNPENVLVFGSGNGREARPIVNKAKRVVCFDYGFGYLLSGKQLCESERIENVYFIAADALHMPFCSSSFDFIFFSIYSSLKEKRLSVLRDVRRIVRPDGFVLLTCVMPWYPQARERGFVTFRDAAEIEKEVSECGFSFLEGGQDPKRTEYFCSILTPKRI